MQRKRKFSISALMLSTAESADNIGKCEWAFTSISKLECFSINSCSSKIILIRVSFIFCEGTRNNKSDFLESNWVDPVINSTQISVYFWKLIGQGNLTAQSYLQN